MKVTVAGSSGFLGSHLVDELRGRGHDVRRLVRREPADPEESRWDPYAGELDDSVIDDADVVVNLSGSRLLGNPHSPRYRANLHDSRVVTTRVLADAIARAGSPPAFVAQNASAWYGDHGEELVTEESESLGEEFMTRVARDWQVATEAARTAGSRVCLMRTVPVMADGSLTFNVLVPVFKLGLGARLGDGRHYFPVVSLRDWVAAAAFLVEHESAAGPFNFCSPEADTNLEFTEAFANALGRRARLAVPAAVLRLGAGQLASETLGSCRMVPDALQSAGFTFQDWDVRDVLRAAF